MGLMDRDYYREKRDSGEGPLRRLVRNPLGIAALLALILFLIGYLLS